MVFDKLFSLSVNYLFLFFATAFILLILAMLFLWKFNKTV